jgi:hypothetical protein
VERTLGEGAIYWSDMTPSSIEQAVRRGRVLAQPTARIAATSLFRDSHDEVEVTRIDATDWVVSWHNKRYEVLTDDHGRMLAAALPEFGVTIERREGYRPEQYPLWPPHAAPPDAPYSANEVAIRAPQGHVLAGTLTTPVLITGLSANNSQRGAAALDALARPGRTHRSPHRIGKQRSRSSSPTP